MKEGMKLNMEDLEKVTGGKWSTQTLTLDELSEYLQLKKAYEDSFKFGNKSSEHDAALANLNAFYDRMDEKYGA